MYLSEVTCLIIHRDVGFCNFKGKLKKFSEVAPVVVSPFVHRDCCVSLLYLCLSFLNFFCFQNLMHLINNSFSGFK